MKTWLKHPKDRIERSIHGENKQVLITTGSRHRKDGKLQGYIVSVIDHRGYYRKYFKMGYTYRDCVTMLAMVDYELSKKNRQKLLTTEKPN